MSDSSFVLPGFANEWADLLRSPESGPAFFYALLTFRALSPVECAALDDILVRIEKEASHDAIWGREAKGAFDPACFPTIADGYEGMVLQAIMPTRNVIRNDVMPEQDPRFAQEEQVEIPEGASVIEPVFKKAQS